MSYESMEYADDCGELDEEPWYEAEDCGCNCNGIDSEWEWRPDQGCYVCAGCGAVQ